MLKVQHLLRPLLLRALVQGSGAQQTAEGPQWSWPQLQQQGPQQQQRPQQQQGPQQQKLLQMPQRCLQALLQGPLLPLLLQQPGLQSCGLRGVRRGRSWCGTCRGRWWPRLQEVVEEAAHAAGTAQGRAW